jgi:hypothetical protein
MSRRQQQQQQQQQHQQEQSERGQLRSGARFARRNTPYYESFAELRRHHARLFEPDPAVDTRHFRIGENAQRGTLLQTTLRIRADETPANIRAHLRSVFARLFRLQPERHDTGFEVVVTFNAALADAQRTSFSVFYGHDHRSSNPSGAAAELRYGDTVIVNNMLDLESVPTGFDFERLVHAHRHSFENSSVSVYKFLSVVYLIYTYVKRTSASAEG